MEVAICDEDKKETHDAENARDARDARDASGDQISYMLRGFQSSVWVDCLELFHVWIYPLEI